MKEIQIFPDPRSLAEAAAHLFVRVSRSSAQKFGKFLVALAGGSTPMLTYQLLAENPIRDQVDWSKTHLFWGDERCVPPEHPDSNYKMVFETLIRAIPIAPSNISRMQGELNPSIAARQYEQVLRTSLGTDRRLDLLILGMGTDGHTASLFPETSAINVSERWVTENYVPKLSSWRLTLTASFINKAHNILFLISGSNKAEALYKVLKGDPKPEQYPSQLIKPIDGSVYFYIDQEAARLI